MANKKTLDDLILEVLNEAESSEPVYIKPISKTETFASIIQFMNYDLSTFENFARYIGEGKAYITGGPKFSTIKRAFEDNEFPIDSPFQKKFEAVEEIKEDNFTGLDKSTVQSIDATKDQNKTLKWYQTPEHLKKLEKLEPNERISGAIKELKDYIEDSQKELDKYRSMLQPFDATKTEDELRKYFSKSAGFDLQKLKTSSGEISSFDIFGTIPVFKQNFEELGLNPSADEEKNALNRAQEIILKNLNSPKNIGKEISKLKENIKVLQEDVDVFDLDDLAELFKDYDPRKPTDLNVGNLSINANSLKKGLVNSYLELKVSLPNSTDKEKKIKIAVLKSIKTLADAVEYYTSGRTVRTRSDAITGFTLGTAQSSETARLSKEMISIFNKVGSGENSIEKIANFSSFLKEINTGFKNPSYEYKGKLEEKFSKFVALEILDKNIFKIEEASAQGFLFEAFLAMLLGGTQTGADRGGADYRIGDQPGSAKFISEFSFKQSRKNLFAEKGNFMEYVIAIKSTKTMAGKKKLAKDSDRIIALDIHMFTIKVTGEFGKRSEKYTAYPKKLKGGVKKYVGDIDDTQVKFDISQLLQESYIGTFDFSFMFEKEFEDYSSQILSQISKGVEKAFNAVFSLRNNITRWITDKDVVAASQVDQDRTQLDFAITSLDEETKFQRKTGQFKENRNKSLKKLDKLIERVILEHINK